MTDLDENLAPEPATDVDPRALDIEPTAEEFFVLSRLNGSTTIGQICKTSGLGRQKTLKCVENLRSYGLIRLPGDNNSDEINDVADSTTSSSASSRHPVKRSMSSPTSSAEEDSAPETKPDPGEALRSRFPIAFSNFEFDQELLDQSVELDDDFKAEVLFVHQQLDDITYYELLGVDRDAQRRALRRAYFPLSKRFHPDRFYQKILGDYERMIQRIFQRVTTAYQTLSDRNKRQEYDDSLHRGRTTHATPRMASTPASRRSEPREVIQGNRKQKMAYKVLVQRGDRALEAGRIGPALKEYRKALTLHREVELPLRIARKLLEREDYLDDAISFARTAHNIDSSSVEALKITGEIYEQKGDISDAIYHYELAQKAAPDDPDLQQRIKRLQD